MSFLFFIFLLFSTSLSQLTPEQKQAITDYHNELRNQIASGLLTTPKLSLASNMGELVWDENLGKLAQTFADKAIFSDNSVRKIPELQGPIKENTYWSSYSGTNKFDVKAAMSAWFSEYKTFNLPNLNYIQIGN